MMLSDVDIKAAMERKELVIEPFRPEFVRACGITLHLGELLLKPKSGTVVDVKNKIVPEHQEIHLTDDKPYPLEHGEFVLGHTWQNVTVGSALGFFIEGRSTLARVGLTIVQTAMMVYPGHSGRAVTLELANHGPNPILLYPRMKIARVALFRLQTPAEVQYDVSGKYRKQSVVGLPIFDDEIFYP
jgi:dCTP deaminase